MAIVINAAPGSFYSANGDLIFVVYEATKANDPVTYPDYKYVADIYVGLTQIARIKKVPQPDNKRGIFNIGDIIRNYITVYFNPLANTLQAQQIGLQQFFVNVTIKFGEEYGFTTYTNLLIDSERFYFNHYNGRMLGQNTILTPYLDKVVSTRPQNIEVNVNDNYTLIPYWPSRTDPIDVVITKHGTSGGGSVTIEWGYFPTDIYSTVDSQTMQFSLGYQDGLNTLNLNYTIAGDEQYLVLKEPSSQPVKTTWFNTVLNNGYFPDSVFRSPIVIDSFRYYVSRIPVVLDSTSYALVFSNGSPDPVASPVTGTTITETITPTESYSGADSVFTGVLSENLSPFVDGNGQLKINTVVKMDITSSGTDVYNAPAGSAYSFEAYCVITGAAANPKMRLTITKDTEGTPVVIFDKQIVAINGASMVKTGIVPVGQGYTFSVTTSDTTTPVTDIDIADDTPVPAIVALQILNVSPGLINTLTPGFIDSFVKYYTVQIGALSLYAFYPVCEARYQVYKLHFLNKFGGFETRNFSKVSRKSFAITKTQFGKLPYTIGSDGTVSYYNSNNVYNETQATYSSQYTETMTLNTDILTDAEYVWLSDLMLSPLVYFEDGGYFYSCQIKATTYEIKKNINDKITNLTIEVQVSDMYNAQYR